MSKKLQALVAVGAFMFAAIAPAMGAEAWPSKPIKLIVPYPPGGSSDNVGRLAAGWLGSVLGQTVVVENKGGAGAIIGTEAAARSAADGHTLLLAPTAVMAITPQLRSVPYSAGDFVPIAVIASSYNLVAARKDLRAGNIAQLAALGKSQPGKTTFGSAGIATATHIAGELVHQALGIQALHVPYKGSGEALTALVGGQIDLIYDPVALPQVKAGTIKALAAGGKTRHPELPDVPTLKEQGVDVMVGSWFGLFAPKGTPKDIIERVADAVGRGLQTPGVEKQLAAMSLYPDFRGPDAFARQIREDTASYKSLIERTGLKAN